MRLTKSSLASIICLTTLAAGCAESSTSSMPVGLASTAQAEPKPPGAGTKPSATRPEGEKKVSRSEAQPKPAPVPQFDSKSAREKFKREFVVPADLVIDDTAVLADVDYRGEIHRIYVSKSFMVDFGGEKWREQLATRHAEFGKYSFYVTPSLTYTRENAQADFQKKTLLIKGHAPEADVYRMPLTLVLLEDDLKEQSRREINRRFPGAAVDRPNIMLVPYSYIEFHALVPQKRLLFTMPDVVPANEVEVQPLIANQKSSLTIGLNGTEADLKAFIAEPQMKVSYIAGGFRVTQDIFDVTMDRFYALGMHHLLTGQAGWSEKATYLANARTEGVNLLGFFSNDSLDKSGTSEMSGSSYVTRNQVKSLVADYVESIRGVVWRETHGEFPREDLQKLMLNDLLSRASATREAKLVEDGQNFVVDKSMLDSAKEDTISSINSDVKSVCDKNKSFHEKAKGNYGAIGGEYEKDQKDIVKDDNGIKWDVKGRIVRPKSVDLYQFNSAAFAGQYPRSFVHVAADRKQSFFEVASIVDIPPPAVYIDKLVLHANVKEDGDDKEESGALTLVVRAAGKEVGRIPNFGFNQFWDDGTLHAVELPLDPDIRINGSTPFEYEVHLDGKNVDYGGVFYVTGITRDGGQRASPVESRDMDTGGASTHVVRWNW